MQSHPYRRPAKGSQSCEVCGALPGAVVHLLALPSMEEADREREEARGLMQRMELEETMRTVKADISAKAREMERNAPLFYGTFAARSVLARRMEGLETPYLFPCDTDLTRPVPKVNNAHDRAVRESKVAAFRLYDLRHTWATRAAESGIDLVTLAALLGHSKIQMVLRYAHPTQEHQARSVERMEQFVVARQMEAQKSAQAQSKAMIQ